MCQFYNFCRPRSCILLYVTDKTDKHDIDSDENNTKRAIYINLQRQKVNKLQK